MIKLIRYIKRRILIVKLLRRNKRYLKKGKYVFDKTMSYLYLKNDMKSYLISNILNNDFKVIAYNNNVFKTFINIIIKFITWPFRIIINNGESHGIALLPSSTLKDFKVFDIDNNKVIAKYSNRYEYEKEIRNYNIFREHLNPPQIYESRLIDLIIVAELINFKPINKMSDDEFIYVRGIVFEYLYNFQKSIIKDKTYANIRDIYIKYTRNKRLEKLISIIDLSDELMKKPLPMNLSHGDLYPSNILYNDINNTVSVIDFEHNGYNLFFYDLFNLIDGETVIRGNYESIDDLISGKYDNYFHKLFKLYNLNYSDFDIVELFKLYFLNSCITKDLLDSHLLDSQIKRFKLIIDYINKNIF